MKSYLFDTNIPSELTREQPDPSVTAYVQSLPQENSYLSVMTLGEIRKGIAGLPLSRKRSELEDWLESHVRTWFANRILPVTASIADRWGEISAEAKRRGNTLSVVDGLIAATALEHDLTIITRNVADFADLGVDVVNPWNLK